MAAGQESGIWKPTGTDWPQRPFPYQPVTPVAPEPDLPAQPATPPQVPDVVEHPPVTIEERPRVVRSKLVSGSTKTETVYRTTKVQEVTVHEVTDNGTGGMGQHGTVNYAGKSLNLRLVVGGSTTDGYKSDHEDSATFDAGPNASGTSASNEAIKGGEYLDNALGESVLAQSTVTVTYAKDFAGEITNTSGYKPPQVTIDLCPYTTDYVVPGSVRFTWMGHVFEDYGGILIRDRTASHPGYAAGQMNYTTGIATVTDYVVSGPATAFTLDSLWTIRQNWNTASIFLRTQAAPLKPSGFVMQLADAQGNQLTAMAGIDGAITGTHLRGRIDYLTGEAELQFGDYLLDTSLTDAQKAEWWYSADDVGAVEPGKIWRPWPVDPTTLRYNSVAYFYLPIDADLLGLDPVRLPQDGRVPIFRAGSYVVVGHTGETPPAVASNGITVNCARTRLSRVRVVGGDGKTIRTGYTADLDAGTVTYTDTTGYVQPVHVQHRIEDLVRVADVQIDGTLKFTRQLTHDFPAGTVVSSALMAGQLRARVSHLFDQQTWDGSYQDAPVGPTATASYNDTAAPLVVTNAGAVTERWALRFTGTAAFDCIGEHVGNIGSGSINADFSPVNPVSGQPYFTIRALGWGAGWAAANVLRINTVGAMASFAVIRTVQAGPEAGINYEFELLARGDVDRPAD